jgi:hypothetical protein
MPNTLCGHPLARAIVTSCLTHPAPPILTHTHTTIHSIIHSLIHTHTLPFIHSFIHSSIPINIRIHQTHLSTSTHLSFYIPIIKKNRNFVYQVHTFIENGRGKNEVIFNSWDRRQKTDKNKEELNRTLSKPNSIKFRQLTKFHGILWNNIMKKSVKCF